MLTADLVDARAKGDELVLRNVDASTRAEALGLAEELLEAARRHVGRRREEVEEALAAVGEGARRRKLVLALRKLTIDDCEFEAGAISCEFSMFVRGAANNLSFGLFEDRMQCTANDGFVREHYASLLDEGGHEQIEGAKRPPVQLSRE